MAVKLGVVMDPITGINYNKDTTMAMLWAAQDRGWELFYMEQTHLYLEQGVARARMAKVNVYRDQGHWFNLEPAEDRDLSELDVILMRKDPPFDNEYIYSTYILEAAEREGTSRGEPLPKSARLQRKGIRHPVSTLLPSRAGQRRHATAKSVPSPT